MLINKSFHSLRCVQQRANFHIHGGPFFRWFHRAALSTAQDMACHALFTSVFVFAFKASSSRLRDRARYGGLSGIATYLPRVASANHPRYQLI
jgi:hypothetical protein